MRDYRLSAHTIYALHYHFVLITKYRKPVLRGDIGNEVRELIREVCRTLDIEILQGHVRPDHVHLLLTITDREPLGVLGLGTLEADMLGNHVVRHVPATRCSGAGTCVRVATSCVEIACVDRRAFCRLQLTMNPSPSGEGVREPLNLDSRSPSARRAGESPGAREAGQADASGTSISWR